MKQSKSRIPATLPLGLLALGSAVAELEANQFSTTTKLKGAANFVLGTNSFGGDATSSGLNDVRLDFDTSFTGEDLLRTRLRAGLGHSDNANEEFGEWGISSSYYKLGFDADYRFSLGNNGSGYLGGGVDYYKFDEDVRNDDEDDAFDTHLRLGLKWNISDSVEFTTDNYLTHSAFGDHGLTLRQGVMHNYLTNFGSDSGLNYGIGGSEARTGFRYIKFNESSEDDFDSEDMVLYQRFTFPSSNGRPSYYIDGSYGCRHYDNHWNDLDSDYYQVNAGIYGELTSGVSYDISGGYEWRKYEDKYIDDQDNVRFSASLLGSPREGLNLAMHANYGVHHLLPNYGWLTMVDPIGWLFGLQVEQSVGNGSALGLSLQHSDLKGDLWPSSYDFERTSAHLYYQFPITDNITITPSLGYTRIEGDSQSDEFWGGLVKTTFKF